jgi:outer membrane protein TolC
MRSGNITIVLLVLLSLILSSGASAQDKKIITLDESLQIGLENSHFLHASRMNVVYAEARLSEIDAQRLPLFRLNGTYTRLSYLEPPKFSFAGNDFEINPTVLNNYTLRFSLQQPLFTGFRLSSSSKIAEYNSKAASEEYRQDEDQLIFDIKNAYWSLFRANKINDFVNENVLQIEAHLKDAQNLLEQGLLTNNDVLKIQVQLSEAQLRQIDAANGVKLAALNLSNTIQLPVSTDLQVPSDITYNVKPTPALDEVLSLAYDQRPELKAMGYRVQAGESGVKLANSGWWPQLYLGANYNVARPNTRVFPLEDKYKDTWDVTVNLQFDLWNWGQTSDQSDQAEAQLEQIRDNHEIIKNAITLEVTQNYLNINQAKEKISVAQKSMGQAEENYRISSEKFKQGLLLSSEMLDAEVALLQARTNYIQSVVDYEIAKARLDRSTAVRNLNNK